MSITWLCAHKIKHGKQIRCLSESKLTEISLDRCLQDFQNIDALRFEQKLCCSIWPGGKTFLRSLPTGFGKSIIFQLFHPVVRCIYKALWSCGRISAMILVSLLILIMRHQVEQLKWLGFLAATTRIREDTEKVTNGEGEIVFTSPESWLPKSWMKEPKEGKLGQ